MGRFRKKPVVVEARQWTGENFDDLFAWGSPDGGVATAAIVWSGGGGDPTKLAVATLEGTMVATVGDWIIRGIKGEFYPCKPDIFEATYEAVE